MRTDKSGSRWVRIVLLSAVSCGCVSDALAQDSLELPVGSAVCVFALPGDRLSLAEAVARALCFDPQTRQAWAAAKQKEAALSVSRAAYLPSVNASLEQGINISSVSSDLPEYDANMESRNPMEEINLQLTLFDFGLRSATVLNAKEELASAYALRDDAVRTVFLQAAKAYYDVLRADIALTSDIELADDARHIRDIAAARHAGGAALVTEELQADSLYSQSQIDVVNAGHDVAVARGTLAELLGIDPREPLGAVADAEASAGKDSLDDVDKLIEMALQRDPKLQSAYAELRAAEATLSVQSAQGLPTVTLAGSASASRQEYYSGSTFSIYQNSANSKSHESTIGVRVTIPLFGSVERAARMRGARAAIDSAGSKVDAAKRDVVAGVWRERHKLQAATQVMPLAQDMVQSAQKFLEASEARYDAGADNLTDVILAHKALETAKMHRLDALVDLRTSRLTLLSAIGELTMSAIR
jgi:outer membrane protein